MIRMYKKEAASLTASFFVHAENAERTGFEPVIRF